MWRWDLRLLDELGELGHRAAVSSRSGQGDHQRRRWGLSKSARYMNTNRSGVGYEGYGEISLRARERRGGRQFSRCQVGERSQICA